MTEQHDQTTGLTRAEVMSMIRCAAFADDVPTANPAAACKDPEPLSVWRLRTNQVFIDAAIVPSLTGLAKDSLRYFHSWYHKLYLRHGIPVDEKRLRSFRMPSDDEGVLAANVKQMREVMCRPTPAPVETAKPALAALGVQASGDHRPGLWRTFD